MTQSRSEAITSHYYKQEGYSYGSILGSIGGVHLAASTTAFFLKHRPMPSNPLIKVGFVVVLSMYAGCKLGGYVGEKIGFFAGNLIEKTNPPAQSQSSQIKI